MMKIRRKFFDTDYGQMHVRIAGPDNAEKLPLLCLHMTPQSGQDFETFMRLAGSDRLVVAPDYHGYGDSSPIMDERAVTIEAYAQSIWQALDGLGVSDVEILGHHTGSKVAIEMALQKPQEVKHLVCISLSTLTPEEYKSASPRFSPLLSRPDGSELEDWWHKLLNYYDPVMPFDALVQKFAISVKTGSRFHLGFQAAHLYNANILKKLESLQVPVVLVNPNDDLQAITPRAAQYIPQCSLIEKPNWMPGFLETDPAGVLGVLVETIRLG